LGASADRWDGLVLYLKQQGLDEQVFIKAGLLKNRDSGGAYDVFRNRLMFPIEDEAGRVIAFGGRRLSETDEAKYLNSPETEIFNKGSTLYALNHASKAIQASKTAIITEGYMDTIACHQAGVCNVVAVLGTGLTREHARKLTRYCSTVVLLFDGDEAGRKAAERTFPIFFGVNIDVKVATLAKYTDAKDPDELLKRPGGREIFDQAIAEAEDLISYRFSRIRESLNGAGPAEISKTIHLQIEELIRLGLGSVEPVRRTHLIRQLANVADVPERDIKSLIPTGRSADHTENVPTPVNVHNGKRVLTLNEEILACLLIQGDLSNKLRMEDQVAISPDTFAHPDSQLVAREIRKLIDDGEPISLAAIQSMTDQTHIHNAAHELMSILMWTYPEEKNLAAFFDDCLVEFHTRESISNLPADPRERFSQLRANAKIHGINRRKLPRPK
jgi:DNA primase